MSEQWGSDIHLLTEFCQLLQEDMRRKRGFKPEMSYSQKELSAMLVNHEWNFYT